MKRNIHFIALLICNVYFLNAQVPQKFSYQAAVRNAQRELIITQDVGFRMSILEGSAGGSPVYIETHVVATNSFGVADMVIGEGSVVSGTFTDIPWGEESLFLKVEVDPAGGSAYEYVGTSQLISVPYALYSANLSSPTQKFTIQENAGHPVDSALFEVRNVEGQTVFAVYPEGTRIYVLDEEGKGRKGGFAVGGYSRTTKGVTEEYMRVTPDSIRIYIDDSDTDTKGRKGGFAVGGYSRTAKGESEYFNISKQEAEVIPGINKVVWYPQRNAFLVGNVLVEYPDSVGENSIATGYQSQAIGNFSEAFGHQSIARGENSTAIGDHATAHGINSVSIGTHSRADKASSFAVGTGAIAFGINSYALGSSGVDSAGLPTGNTMSIGEQSFALGMGSRAEGFGSFSIGTEAQSIGDYSFAMGYKTQAFDDYSTAIGKEASASGHSSTAMGYKINASGSRSLAMGEFTNASGTASIAIGVGTTASGNSSTAMGSYTNANGWRSIAMGEYTTANGTGSAAIGSYSDANGYYSTTLGRYTIAGSYCSVALGQYNANRYGDSNSWVNADPLFIVGNGTSDSDRQTAMLVRKDGSVYFPDIYQQDALDGFPIPKPLYIGFDGKIGTYGSSERYKDNITSMEDVGWLYNLRPVNFNFISDETDTKQYGLIAEEVEKVIPSFVYYDEDGEPESVSYHQLITPVIKALQEQDKLIKELQARIEELERE